MPALLLRLVLLLAIAACLGARAAQADIYTWIDAKGGLNVSNIPPPDDAKVLKVVQTGPPASAAEDAGRAPTRAPDTQALADRVRQLEAEVAMAASQPPLVVAPPPSPPIVQYIIQNAPPVMQYVVNEAPQGYAYASPSCDPSWYSCGWWPGYYPSYIVVGPTSNLRPFKPGRGMDFRPHPPHPQPVQTSFIQPLQVPFIQPIVGAQPFGGVPHADFHKG